CGAPASPGRRTARYPAKPAQCGSAVAWTSTMDPWRHELLLPRRWTSVPCGRRSTGLLAGWQIVAIVRYFDAGGVQPELCLFPEVDVGLPPFRALDPAAQVQHHGAIRQGVDEDDGLRIGQHPRVAGDFQQCR